jgi:hypothetical protein
MILCLLEVEAGLVVAFGLGFWGSFEGFIEGGG